MNFEYICIFNKLGVVIEYPSNEYIEERLRKDLDSIDSIFRYYLVPREIQFHTNAISDGLPYFLRCKGSTKSVSFTVPTSANMVRQFVCIY
jgi:hypothetical protein